MAWLNFTEDYLTGIPEIDYEHRKLFELINMLFEATMSRRSEKVVSAVIEELKNYTVYHFRNEENIFEPTMYPNKAKHIEEHNEFVQNIMLFEEDFKSGRSSVSLEILDFLKHWLTDHICVRDKVIKHCLV